MTIVRNELQEKLGLMQGALPLASPQIQCTSALIPIRYAAAVSSCIVKMTKKKANNLPLVSVVVITYNSADYVIETLESIKNQTYPKIDLVISDDCSNDDTVKICEEWLAKNSSVFSSAQIVTAKINSGIPANCNRALNNSTGKWIKTIAGDDILLPNCIETFYEATLAYQGISCFVSDMYVMSNNSIDRQYKILKKYLPKDASRQLDNLISYKSPPGPTLFVEREALLAVRGYDERYPGVEDYPLYIRLVQAGYYFIGINTPTVVYRVHNDSVTQTASRFFIDSLNAHFEEVVKPLIHARNHRALVWHLWLEGLLAKKRGYKRIAISCLMRLTDLIYWRNKLMPFFGMTPHAQIKIIKIKSLKLNSVLSPRRQRNQMV